jgi:hypothetical protein
MIRTQRRSLIHKLNATRRRARRVAVASEEPLIGHDRYDYADAFEIGVPATDARSPEEFVRDALTGAARPLRVAVVLVHKHVLRLQLGPMSSPRHLFGWEIIASRPDVFHLAAVSPLLGRGALVLRRPSPTRLVFTTYLFHARPVAPRAVWSLVGPLHRWVAPYLMEKALERRA